MALKVLTVNGLTVLSNWFNSYYDLYVLYDLHACTPLRLYALRLTPYNIPNHFLHNLAGSCSCNSLCWGKLHPH